MKYGFVMPSGNARDAANLAYEAEQSGWDGFFAYEPVWGTDAWVALTAAAMRTERIRLGTMLTPIARMKPWKLASETATLDDLSGGRVILAIGLGAPDAGYHAFGEETDRKLRAEMTDEGLDILEGLWRGQPFSYSAKHYQVEPFEAIVAPPPVQQPRIPIWMVGAHGRPISLRRAAKYDGVLANGFDANGNARDATPEELAEVLAAIRALRPEGSPYDAIADGVTPGDDRAAAAEIVRPKREAGATWWLEANWSLSGPDVQEQLVKRLRQGPPTA
jgi:alkanesulfonate monooxygenase SsuD/methylene tetrahydromethanopterin reductase-like flavin-dependent oxidoreductase (luciferase family)